MNILYIGDIMGRAGRDIVADILPSLKEQRDIDFVVAQGENASHGKSITERHMGELRALGVDFFSGGDHTLERPQLYDVLNDKLQPIIRPANLDPELPGLGWKIASTEHGDVLVVSLLGSIFPEKYEISNPLKTIDSILDSQSGNDFAAIIVNLHGDYSSEKRVIGYYLDGRVSAVIGDHWHVPTADSMVLPKGTGHITDVGMCGSLHSSLGVDLEVIIPRWRDGKGTKQLLAMERPYQFNALLVQNVTAVSAGSVEHISIVA